MIYMIAACSKNNVIGMKGAIPWRLRNDMRFFRQTTEGHTVVMGRKTFESIGKPLVNRRNIVLSRQKNYQPAGVEVVSSAESLLTEHTEKPLFVIGGEEIYKLFLPKAQRVYLTVVHVELEGDAFFPQLGRGWKKVQLVSYRADKYNEYDHTIYEFSRS